MRYVKKLKNLLGILFIYAAKLIKPGDKKQISYRKFLRITTSENSD